MRISQKIAYLSIVCMMLYLACSTPAQMNYNSQNREIISAKRLYVMPFQFGNNPSLLSRTELAIINWDTGEINRKVALERSWAGHLNVDPARRFWIGYDGTFSKNDDRVHVYSQSGEFVRELKPCVNPGAGIRFIRNQAYIVCTLDGRRGKIVSVDLHSFELQAEIDLGLPDNNLLLNASSANQSALIVSAYTSGPLEAPYSRLLIVNDNKQKVDFISDALVNVQIEQIVANGDQFYVLNAASRLQSRDQAQDILIVDPAQPTRIQALTTAPSPLWGDIEENQLYTYHNPEYGQANRDPSRLFSRTNLQTGEVDIWPLPNNWNAYDVKIVQGQVVMAGYYKHSAESADGIYVLDLNTGQLTRRIDIDGQSKIAYLD